jgi:hypothetical protein
MIATAELERRVEELEAAKVAADEVEQLVDRVHKEQLAERVRQMTSVEEN